MLKCVNLTFKHWKISLSLFNKTITKFQSFNNPIWKKIYQLNHDNLNTTVKKLKQKLKRGLLDYFESNYPHEFPKYYFKYRKSYVGQGMVKNFETYLG